MIIVSRINEKLTFGKHKGKTIEEVMQCDFSYFEFIRQGNFGKWTAFFNSAYNELINPKKSSNPDLLDLCEHQDTDILDKELYCKS